VACDRGDLRRGRARAIGVFSFTAAAGGSIGLLAGGRWPLVLLPGVLGAIDRGVIAREETYLEERFGDLYRKYRSRVRRWL